MTLARFRLYDRPLTKGAFFIAQVAIALLLGLLMYLTASANASAKSSDQRADHAARAACQLVQVVHDQNALLTNGIAVLLAPPDTRDAAMRALRDEVERERVRAQQAAKAVSCT